MTPPREIVVPAHGLEHRVLEWGKAQDASGGATFLVHGYMDAAGTWDLVAPSLGANARVLAPDMRGYGRGARIPHGAYYYFTDYVFDLADLVDELVGPTAPIDLVGHSMGGTISTLFAGTFPERVRSLAILEGVGPPDNPPSVVPTRMRRWIDQVRGVRKGGAAQPRMTREEALSRLAANHGGIDRAILATRLPHLIKETDDGRVEWAFDLLHRTVSPIGFSAAVYMEFAKLVTAPVLFVDGGPTGYHPPDEADRLACFARLEKATLEGAGHMLHWTRPAELAGTLGDFFARSRAG